VFASAAVLAAAWALGMIASPVLPAAKPAAVVTPPPAPAEPEPAPARTAEPAPTAEAAKAEPRSAQIKPTELPADAGADPAADGSVAAAAAGEPDAAAAVAATADAGPTEDAPATPPPPPPAPAAEKKPPARNTRGAMQHALALSQVRRGEAALEQGRPDEALVSFRAALESEPTIATAFRGMGMAYAAQGKNVQALWAYDKYLRLAPVAPDAAEIRRSIRELKARAKVGAKEQ
jgi:tetratricopeptide (TPR) repeat protein